jgi:hypothetical protein
MCQKCKQYIPSPGRNAPVEIIECNGFGKPHKVKLNEPIVEKRTYLGRISSSQASAKSGDGK